MALRGNLRDFSLPDVFQLVTFSKKTGVLRIRRADGTDGSVWFRDGEVFFAQSNWHGEPLGERLVHANRITPSALAKALDLRAKEGADGRRLGEILIEEGYITDKVLEAFVQEQIQDTIFDLMRWDEGEFDFELLPDVVDEDIGLSVSIENVIMEGSRRLEEWTRIKKKIPSMEIVFKMATAPGEGTFEISLKPIEWNLLLLVDGTRSVSELAAETNRTDFEVARIMYGLFSAGLLEVASDDEVEQLRAERVEREALLAQIRAEEAAIEAEATDAALAREAALEAEAEARAAAEAQAAAKNQAAEAAQAAALESEAAESERERADAAAAEVAALADRPEPEMPEFLAGDTTAASSDDMAVFAEMMGAVLESQGESEAESLIEPAVEPVVEPEIEPAIEPAAAVEEAVATEPELQDEATVPESVTEPVPVFPTDATPVMAESVENAPVETAYVAPEEFVPQDLLSVEQEPLAPESEITEPEPAAQTLYEFDLAADLQPETASEPPAIDLLPADESDQLSGLAEEFPGADGALEALRAELAIEPQSESEASAPKVTGDLERDLMALGLGELPGTDQFAVAEPAGIQEPLGTDTLPVEARADTAFEEIASLSDLLAESEQDLADQSLSDETDLIDGSEADAPSETITDLTDILESLDTGTLGEDTEIVQTVDLESVEQPEVASSGVISTDAFLADIAGDDLGVGLSSGLGDELSALTGAGGSKRPTASVNKIPDAGTSFEIHRDHAVDKDLLLKIIEGIKGL